MPKTKPFLNNNFLLQSEVAEQLFHNRAKDLPIIDYHNHLPPDEIADDKKYRSLTEIWLDGDHYKWRAMRANGVNEKFITGDASDRDKFIKWAETIPYTMRNPLYHWTHLELQRYFGITELLDAQSASSIYDQANAQLQQPGFTAQGLLRKMNVEVVCTTDHPTDKLEHHLAAKDSLRGIKMLPTFRPDKLVVVTNPDFSTFLSKLEAIVGYQIDSFDNLLTALEERIEFFATAGCQLADHGLSRLYDIKIQEEKLDGILSKGKSQDSITQKESAMFQMAVLYKLGEMYHARNWTMQFHLGAIRNNNLRLMNSVGADVGCDSIGDYEQAEGLSAFLRKLDTQGQLTKTILYNLNPRDNEVFATMAGNFNDGITPGKIQWGSAWWFLDQKDGMEKQLNALSNMGLLSRFVGMLTDSRSFLSFPRHEYFRRILCNLIGKDVVNGELPADMEWLGKMVENICYYNAQNYFNFSEV